VSLRVRCQPTTLELQLRVRLRPHGHTPRPTRMCARSVTRPGSLNLPYPAGKEKKLSLAARRPPVVWCSAPCLHRSHGGRCRGEDGGPGSGGPAHRCSTPKNEPTNSLACAHPIRRRHVGEEPEPTEHARRPGAPTPSTATHARRRPARGREGQGPPRACRSSQTRSTSSSQTCQGSQSQGAGDAETGSCRPHSARPPARPTRSARVCCLHCYMQRHSLLLQASR
jgi:hypothetical protein